MLPSKVIEYVRENGSNPYRTWFNSLNLEAATKVTFARAKIEHGLTSSIKWFEGIGEYRIDWGPGLRIYLAQDGNKLIVLLGGGTKKRQDEDIRSAIKLHREYKERKTRSTPEEWKSEREKDSPGS